MVGVSTLVAHKGEIIHSAHSGYQNRAQNIVTSDATIYRIYSMTKPIISAALMMLWEEGKFALSDPLGDYLPEFANTEVYAGQAKHGAIVSTSTKQNLSILDLLRHTSGLSAPSEDKGPVERLYLSKNIETQSSLAKLSQCLGTLPLVCEPGTAWHYSLSSDIQGRLIEVLSGQSLDDFLAQRIFSPLEMRDTAFYVPPEKSQHLSEMYAFTEQAPLDVYTGSELSDFLQPPAVLSGGIGLVASTLDFWKFSQMLANKGSFNGQRLLQENTIALMTQNHLPKHIKGIWDDNSGLGYGLSLGVVTDPSKIGGHSVSGEYYWEGKANSLFFVVPGSNTVAIVMSNMFPYWSLPLLADMRKLVYRTCNLADF